MDELPTGGTGGTAHYHGGDKIMQTPLTGSRRTHGRGSSGEAYVEPLVGEGW